MENIKIKIDCVTVVSYTEGELEIGLPEQSEGVDPYEFLNLKETKQLIEFLNKHVERHEEA